jgi:hypothetical protein
VGPACQPALKWLKIRLFWQVGNLPHVNYLISNPNLPSFPCSVRTHLGTLYVLGKASVNMLGYLGILVETTFSNRNFNKPHFHSGEFGRLIWRFRQSFTCNPCSQPQEIPTSLCEIPVYFQRRHETLDICKVKNLFPGTLGTRTLQTSWHESIPMFPYLVGFGMRIAPHLERQKGRRYTVAPLAEIDFFH